MRCPYCANTDDKVVDSRETREGQAIRRRRECQSCHARFTTYEEIDDVGFWVVKKDGRREEFSRQKLLNGLLKACQKRPVPIPDLEQIVDEVEQRVRNNAKREIIANDIGDVIMRKLRGLDKVAYIRFASVYRDFEDVTAFVDEIGNLVEDDDADAGG